MATIGKARLKKLLAKGLTGWEAGKLMLREGLERQRGRQGLTDSEVSTIKNGLKDNKDISDFNNLIDLGMVIDHIDLKARITALEISKRIFITGEALTDYFDDMRLRVLQADRPKIVTEKQYQDLRAEHREANLQQSYPLDQVLAWRAMELAPDEIKAKVKYPLDLEEKYPDLYGQLSEQGKGQIKELIKTGKLNLIHYEGDFSKTDRRKMQALEGKLIKEGLTDKELETLLDKAHISGEQLYNSGLPEWPRWINGEDDFYDKENTFYQVAIIQAPRPDDIDEQGYYKEDILAPLPPLFRAIKKGDEDTAGETIQRLLEMARGELRHFLAFKTAIEEASKVVGIGFIDNINRYEIELTTYINSFNKTLDSLQGIGKTPVTSSINIDPHQIEPIKISKLKPDPKTLKTARNNIGGAGLTREGGFLGEGWWKKKGDRTEQEEEAPEVGEEDSLDD